MKFSRCSKWYYGETERDAKIRLKKHISHCKNRNSKASALALHLSNNPGHFPDAILCKLLTKKEEKILEKSKKQLI